MTIATSPIGKAFDAAFRSDLGIQSLQTTRSRSRLCSMTICCLIGVGIAKASFDAWGQVLPENVEVVELAGGFSFLEGPVWVPDGNYLIFSDQTTGIEYKWSETEGVTVNRNLGHSVNGHALDREGRLIVCENGVGLVTRIEPDGTVTPLVGGRRSMHLNGPNDVVVKSDGTIWFTDPAFDGGEVTRQFVYRYHPDTGVADELITDQNYYPNGLGFSPDESIFYLNLWGENTIWHYGVNEDGTLTDLGAFASDLAGPPDGMAIARNGDLYVAMSSAGSQTGVDVFKPDGTFVRRIGVPGSTTNCAFGGAGGNTLFITSGTTLYKVELASDELQIKVSRAVELRWPTEPGKTYQLQYATEANQDWVDLGEPITGTGEAVSVYERTEDYNQRFYQIVVK